MAEQDVHSIVVVGDMNPQIFHPLWFAREGLLTESEAEEAEVKLVHPDIVAFSADWLEAQVTREKFIIKTKMEAYFEPLRDLAIGTFSLLAHTPLRAVGVNFDRHVKIREDKLEELTNKFAPKNFWEEKGLNTQFEGISVSIDKSTVEHPLRFLKIKIEPSALIENGIFLNLNYHTQLKPRAGKENFGDQLVAILNQDWASMKKEIDQITKKITH